MLASQLPQSSHFAARKSVVSPYFPTDFAASVPFYHQPELSSNCLFCDDSRDKLGQATSANAVVYHCPTLHGLVRPRGGAIVSEGASKGQQPTRPAGRPRTFSDPTRKPHRLLPSSHQSPTIRSRGQEGVGRASASTPAAQIAHRRRPQCPLSLAGGNGQRIGGAASPPPPDSANSLCGVYVAGDQRQRIDRQASSTRAAAHGGRHHRHRNRGGFLCGMW